jgi:TolB protein
MGGVVSPDGKYIAFTLSKHGNADIYIMPYDGNRPTQLTRSWGQDVSPTFSPDGQEIAFVSSRSGNPHIYVMDIHGKNQRRITFQGKYNQEPSWSPVDAEQIVFTARDEKLIYDIFTVNPQNSFIQRLTQDAGNNDAPSFSPDGSSIVFTSDRESKKYQRSIWIMDVDGTGQRPLPLPPGHYENPQWGPRRLRYD